MSRWGLLRAGEENGSLIGPVQRLNISNEVGKLLVHAVLLSHGKSLTFSHLIDHPALFPFALDLTMPDLMRDPTFQVQRQGDQSDFVELKSA